MPWIAPSYAFDAAPASADRPVFANGRNEIGAASGSKPALAADEVTKRKLVDTNAGNQQVCRNLPDETPNANHGESPARSTGLAGLALRAKLVANLISECWSEARSGSLPARGMQIKSSGGRSCCESRNASRSNRFQRLRMTALPILREATSPNRACPQSFGTPYTVSHRSATDRLAAKTRSNSAERKSRNRLGNE